MRNFLLSVVIFIGIASGSRAEEPWNPKFPEASSNTKSWITTNHGGEISILWLEPHGEPQGILQILLGVETNYDYVEQVVRFALRNNFSVRIGQNHGVQKRFDLGSKLTTAVNLNNVFLDDATAQLEAVVAANKSGLPIDLLGHSQGGLAVESILSNSSFLTSLESKYGGQANFRGANVIAAPDLPEDQRLLLKIVSSFVLPVLRKMEKAGVKSIHPLEPALDILQFYENHKTSISHWAAYLASKAVMLLAREAIYHSILSSHVHPKSGFERLARESLSPVPIGIFIGFAEALEKNRFADPDDDTDLIEAERMGGHFKYLQIVTVDQDVFNRVSKQGKLFRSASVKHKRHVILHGYRHGDPPLIDEQRSPEIVQGIYGFHLDPKRATRLNPVVHIQSPKWGLISRACSILMRL